jgi:hypothetical protein
MRFIHSAIWHMVLTRVNAAISGLLDEDSVAASHPPSGDDRVRDARALAAIRSCEHHSIMISSPNGTIQSRVAFRLCLKCGAIRDAFRDWETPWYARVVTDPEKIVAQDRAIAFATRSGKISRGTTDPDDIERARGS